MFQALFCSNDLSIQALFPLKQLLDSGTVAASTILHYGAAFHILSSTYL